MPVSSSVIAAGLGKRRRQEAFTSQEPLQRLRTALLPKNAVAPKEQPALEAEPSFDAYAPSRKITDMGWSNRGCRASFASLLKAYNKNRVDELTASNFVDLIATLTEGPSLRAQSTGKPNIALHTIKIDGVRGNVHVLRRDDHDGVADLRMIPSDDIRHNAVQKAIELMEFAACQSRSQLLLCGASSNMGKRLQAMWRSGPRSREFRQLYEAFRNTPRFEYVNGGLFLWILNDLTTKPNAVRSKTGVDGVDKFGIRIPGTTGFVHVLRRLDTNGELADIRLVPSLNDEKDENDILDEMHKAARKGRSLKSDKRRLPRAYYVAEGARNLWNHRWHLLAEHLGRAYEAFCQHEIDNDRRRPSTATFAKYIDQLCEASKGEVVDQRNNIVRHRITPIGSSEPVAMLRCKNETLAPYLRYAGKNSEDESKALELIKHSLRAKAGKDAAASAAHDEPLVSYPAFYDRGTHAGGIHDAQQLKRLLKLMIKNKEAGRPLRHKLADATNIPEADIRAYFSKNGQLKRKPSSLCRLNGFYETVQDLHRLLIQLGHDDTAAQLPYPMSAELLVKVLRTWNENRNASEKALARLLKVNATTISSYFKPNGPRLSCTDHRLRHLPGYDVHWVDIRNALREVGLVDRAQRLPKPETRAELFLRAIREELYPIGAAVQAMKSDPNLSVPDAAKLVTASGEVANLMEQILRPGGVVRTRGEIEAQLPELKLHQFPELDDLLSKLDAPPSSRMSRVLISGFRARANKLFVVNGNPGDLLIKRATKNRLAEVYANSPELVVPPRSFMHERDKQALRWLSTALKSEFKRKMMGDVQCYFDATEQQIWVSSNSVAVNLKINEFLSSGKLKEMLSNVEDHVRAKRVGRHKLKLGRQLAKHDEEGLGSTIMQAMSKGSFRVPTDTVFQHGKSIDLHAERRIKEAFTSVTGRTIDHKMMAGTMRPCTVCAMDLDLPPEVHRGPAWLSRAAQAFYDANEVIEDNIAQSIGTYVSRMNDGHLSVNYNTDSDSEIDVPLAKQVSAARAGKEGEPSKATRGKRAREGSRGEQTQVLSLHLVVPRKPRTRRVTEISEAIGGRPATPAAMLAPAAASPGTASQEDLGFLANHLEPALWRPYRPDEQKPDIRRDAPGASGHVTSRPSNLPATSDSSPSRPDGPWRALATSPSEDQHFSILRNQAAEAALLLGELGVQTTGLPENESQMMQVLEQLVHQGGQRFLSVVERDVPPTREEADTIARVGEASARLRRSMALQGWLQQPTHGMPADQSHAGESWHERQLLQLFERGSASGEGNICWFDTMAQLALSKPRTGRRDAKEVQALAAKLRRGADRLGLSLTGQMFDNDNGAMHMIASALGLQVHAFQQRPDGGLTLSSLHTVGAPGDRSVYLHNDGVHFVPLWPQWTAQERVDTSK